MSNKLKHDILIIVNKSNKHVEFICVNKPDEKILFSVSTKTHGNSIEEIATLCHQNLAEQNIGDAFSIYTKYRYHGVIKQAIDALINKNK